VIADVIFWVVIVVVVGWLIHSYIQFCNDNTPPSDHDMFG